MTNVVQEHPSVTEKQKWVLNASDRCDRCNAQALVKVVGASGYLLFCGHHYGSIMDNAVGYDAMMKFMVSIVDEREKIEYKKPIGAI